MEAIAGTQFTFPNQTNFYNGKVRDVYSIGENVLVMVASDRISAFDVVLPRAIPFKGQVLNQIAERMLNETEDIVPNWKISSPDPNVTVGTRCEPFAVEMVIRGYLTGHAWRTYHSGGRILCGVQLPDEVRSGLYSHGSRGYQRSRLAVPHAGGREPVGERREEAVRSAQQGQEQSRQEVLPVAGADAGHGGGPGPLRSSLS